MARIEIEDDIYEALNVPERERDRAVKAELAISLYERRMLSFGKARALAGMSKPAFHRLLGDRGIERHYTEDELDEDRRYARG